MKKLIALSSVFLLAGCSLLPQAPETMTGEVVTGTDAVVVTGEVMTGAEVVVEDTTAVATGTDAVVVTGEVATGTDAVVVTGA